MLGIACAVYLTDRPSSDLETIGWLPGRLHAIARWADYHGRFRNVPAYALLALPLLAVLRRARARGKGILALAVFAMAMEYTQLLIPTRFFEWQDIAESWLGLAAAWLSVEGALWAARSVLRPKPGSGGGPSPAREAPPLGSLQPIPNAVPGNQE